MAEVIDMTPTWRGVLPICMAGLEAGGTAYSSAHYELLRMADAADRWNEHGGAMLEALRDVTACLRGHHASPDFGPLDDDAVDAALAIIARIEGDE